MLGARTVGDAQRERCPGEAERFVFGLDANLIQFVMGKNERLRGFWFSLDEKSVEVQSLMQAFDNERLSEQWKRLLQ